MNYHLKFIFLFSFLLFRLVALTQFSSGYELNDQTWEATDIELADIDNDGLIDVIVAHQLENKISWFRNLGGNQFELIKDITNSILDPVSLAVGDIDNDGDIDIFGSSGGSDEIYWYENDSLGNFSAAQLIGTGWNPELTSADLNGDGLIDLIAGLPSTDEIKWYENLGGGAFDSGQVITSEVLSQEQVIVSDLDGDLDLDIVTICSFENELSWFENLGGGAFGPQQVITNTLNNPKGLHAADLDNDGDQDITVIRSGDNTLAWYENLGGSFSAENIISTEASFAEHVHCADMNGDGNIDILTNEQPGQQAKFVWFENTGGGTFSGSTEIADNSYTSVIRSADMDADGDIDVVNLNASMYQIIYHENPGNGSFGIDKPFTDWGSPTRGKPVDIDLDGDVDVLLNDNGTFWCENLGDGTFGAIKHYISGSNQGAEFGDLDNDGDLDIVLAKGGNNSSVNLAWMENLGSENFAAEIDITSGLGGTRNVEVVDLNNDGLLDIVAGAGTNVAWFENLGGGNFSSMNILGSVQWCNSIEIADLNNNGELDILYVSRDDNFVCWNENLGNSSFGPQTVIGNNQNGATGTSVGDIDNDGDLDVFVTSRNDDKIAWYENLGNGNFGTENIISTSLVDAFDVMLADFDIDGDLDVAVGSLNASIRWFENLGGGNFGPGQAIAGTSGLEGIDGADYDNDGDIDILAVMFSTNSIKWLENYNISSMQIKGRIYVDDNNNGDYDSSEVAIPQLGLISTPSVGYTYTYPDGRYFMIFNGLQGNYEIKPQPLQFWGVSTDSSSYTINVGPNFTSIDSLDFGFYPDTAAHDLELSLIGGFPRCNDHVNYWIDLQNMGAYVTSGVIHLQLNSDIEYISANVVPDSIVGQDIYWNYDSLQHFETSQINMYVEMPDFQSMGDTLLSTVEVATDSMGTIVYTTADTLSQILACAYDPNDKQAFPSGDSLGYIWPAPETIDYLIRFQNTGTDTALTVVIKDQLDDNLVWNSLRQVAHSHPMNIDVSANGEVSFIFDDIMLPDSNVNEPARHGFVKFSIDVIPGIPIESQISNTANIYFDLNPAIITNTVIHILDTLDTGTVGFNFVDSEKERLLIYPNPFSEHLNINYSNNTKEKYFISLIDIQGRELMKTQLKDSQQTSLNLISLDKSVYFIRLINENNELLFVRKIIRE